jgi:hypothetical protein
MEIPEAAAVWKVRSQAVLPGPAAVALGAGFRLWPMVEPCDWRLEKGRAGAGIMRQIAATIPAPAAHFLQP